MALDPISITAPAHDPDVAYGIGGLALAVAALWISIFARGIAITRRLRSTPF